MSSYRKNVLVGVTVLGGLLALAFMILKFSDRPARLFAPARLNVRFTSDRSDGISEGSPVLYRGVEVGRVSGVRIDDNGQQVLMAVEINRTPPLPRNVRGLIKVQNLIGSGAAITLEVTSEASTEIIREGDQFTATFIGLDLLPPQMVALADALRATADEIRKTNLIGNLAGTIANVGETAKKAGVALDSLQEVVGDQAVRDNLKTAVANLTDTTSSAKRVGEKLETFGDDLNKLTSQASDTLTVARTTITKADTHLDNISKQLAGRMEQTAKVLEDIRSITSKIDAGTGTAGQLVNDPRLYEGLVDSTRELSLTIKDLKRLVEQWEQEGVTLKFGK